MVQRNQRRVSTHGVILLLLILLNAIILKYGYIINQQLYWWLIVSVPLLLAAIYKIWRNRINDIYEIQEPEKKAKG